LPPSLIILAQILQFKSADRFDEVVNPEKVLLFEIIMIIDGEGSILLNIVFESGVHPFFKHPLLTD
jgi:hypothetical protein